MRIDIREQDEEVNEIVFHNIVYTEWEAYMLHKDNDGVTIRNGNEEGIVYLVSECQVKYLIKALEKSIKLGWFQE